jgi:colanic acid/amylovoran biosynthesis glycosyltransferase
MHVWLAQTTTWLYIQTRSLPERIRNHIVCDETENLTQFPIADLVSADRDSWLWRSLGAHSWQVARRRRDFLLRRQIRISGATILHSHFGDRGWENVRTAERSSVRHVVTFYGYDVSRLPRTYPLWRERYRRLFSSADLFLCEGPHLRDRLVDLGCPDEKAVVHHLGIDTAACEFAPRAWAADEPLRVLIAGSFVEKKGIPYALQALDRISKLVDIEVTVIGDSTPQERSKKEKAVIMEILASTGLMAKTRLLGYVPHAELLREARRNHVFVAPSVTAGDGDTEGGAPVSLIEMAATGMPVVSSFHCDIPMVLEDRVTGLLAEERDVAGIEKGLRWLIDNREAWAALVTAARRHIEREFSAEKQGARLAAIYDRLAGAPA